jgi:hypothetical protein
MAWPKNARLNNFKMPHKMDLDDANLLSGSEEGSQPDGVVMDPLFGRGAKGEI